MRTFFYIVRLLLFFMIEFEGEYDISEKNLDEFGSYYEIDWWLNKSPNPEWVKEFEKDLKPFLEKENELFGPFKPKIINCILITTLLDKNKIEDQKKFFEKKFFNSLNEKFD